MRRDVDKAHSKLHMPNAIALAFENCDKIAEWWFDQIQIGLWTILKFETDFEFR